MLFLKLVIVSTIFAAYFLNSVECCAKKRVRIISDLGGEHEDSLFVDVLPWIADHLSDFITFEFHIWDKKQHKDISTELSERAREILCALDAMKEDSIAQTTFLQCEYRLPAEFRISRNCFGSLPITFDTISLCKASLKGKLLALDAKRSVLRLEQSPVVSIGGEKIVNPSEQYIVEKICKEAEKHKNALKGHKWTELFHACENIRTLEEELLKNMFQKLDDWNSLQKYRRSTNATT